MEKEAFHQDPNGGAGRHILTLAALFRRIILITFVVAAMGGAGAMALKTILPKYETSADVAIIRTGATVAIDTRFDATTETRPRIRGRVENMTARRAALIGLVHSGDLATRVVERLGELLEGYEQPVDKLLQDVSAELVTIGAFSRMNQSDLIRITVDADSPERSAAIANAWADEYVVFVNKLYEQVSQPVIARVQNEVEKTEQAYITAQNTLETFLANSKISYFTHLIEMNTEIVNKYREIRNTTTATLANSTIDSQIQRLSKLQGRKRSLVELLHNTQGLLSQIENGGDAGTDSNALAIRILKLQIYVDKGALPENMELEISAPAGKQTINAEEQIADVKSLTVSLEQRIAQTDLSISSAISSLSRVLIDAADSEDVEEIQNSIESSFLDDLYYYLLHGDQPLRKLIVDLESENQLLREQIEAENFQIHNLTQRRDLIRSGLETLQNEQLELQLAAAATSSEVRLASSAVTPQKSAWPSPVLAAAACGTTALSVVLFLVIFMGLWGGISRPLHR